MVASSETRNTATLAIQKIGQGDAAADGEAAAEEAAGVAWECMAVRLGRGEGSEGKGAAYASR